MFRLWILVVFSFNLNAYKSQVHGLEGGENAASFEGVFKHIEGLVVDLDQAGNEIKFSKNPLQGILGLIEENVGRIKPGITKVRNELINEKYLSNIIYNWPRFSDSIKPLWSKVVGVSSQANGFFLNVTTALEKSLRDYKKSVEDEVDPTTSPINEKFLTSIKSNVTELLKTKLQSQDKELSISEFQTQCQALVEEVANYEINNKVQSSKRKRRAAPNKACTKSVNFALSSRSQIVSWSENLESIKIPSPVTFVLLSCYEVQITEGILEYILFAFDDAEETKIQKLQEKQTNLDLTTMWTFNKFSNPKQSINLHKSQENGKAILAESPNGMIEAEEIWMCTPGLKEISIGENVLRFSGSMQTCIVEEMNLHLYKSCSGKCHHYYDPIKNSNEKSNSIRQSGSGVKCKRLPKGAVTICPSNLKDQLYEWFDAENPIESVQSKPNNCTTKLLNFTEHWQMEMGSPIMKSPELCEICQCDSCSNYNEKSLDKYGKKYYTNFFRIGEIVSDIEKGMVVTGMKFEAKHGVLYVSIEQGKLLPNNKIDSATLSWIQPKLPTNYSSDPSIVELKADFLKLNLDSLDMLHNIKKGLYILTGIRFHHHDDHLSLEAQLTEFDTAKGQPKSSLWINGLHNHQTRTTIESGLAEFHTAQGGQVIQPYFDGQAVQPPGTKSRLPFGGIEIFHNKNGENLEVISFRLLGIKGVIE